MFKLQVSVVTVESYGCTWLGYVITIFPSTGITFIVVKSIENTVLCKASWLSLLTDATVIVEGVVVDTVTDPE